MKKSISVLVMAAVMAGSTTFMPMHTAEAGQLEDTVVKGIGAIFRGIFDKSNTESESSKQGNVPNLSESGKQKHARKNPTNNEKLFFIAVKDGNIDVAKQTIANGVDINGVYNIYIDNGSGNGYTPVAVAIENNDRDMVQFLFENGADPTGYYRYDGDYKCYMVDAAGDGDFELVKYLHNWGAKINTIGNYNGHFLANTLNMCIESGVSDELTIPMIEYLVNEGIDMEFAVNWNSRYRKDTPYLLAVKSKRYKLIEYLASIGANINVRDRDGKNAYDIALDSQDMEFIQFITQINARGQQPSKKNSNNN